MKLLKLSFLLGLIAMATCSMVPFSSDAFNIHSEKSEVNEVDRPGKLIKCPVCKGVYHGGTYHNCPGKSK